jgi:trehalose 2-sulfotransferase
MRAYLVCATPRSGSTLLCEMLRDTGRAGLPLEHFEILRHSGLPRQPREYFADLQDPGLLELLAKPQSHGPSTEAPFEWWARIVREGMGDNGVWGGKLMWGHVDDLVCRARGLPGLAGAQLEDVLHELLDDPRLIFVTRGDKIAQAVSLWRAVQSQSWRADEERDPQSVVYDFTGIDHLVAQLESEERAWREWFARTDRRPTEVTYEQLESAPGDTVAAVLRVLGLRDAGVTVPRLARQRDDLSQAWIHRYRRERDRAA